MDIVSSMQRIDSTGRAVYDRVDDMHKQVDELKQEIIGLKRSILNIHDNFLENSRKLDVLIGLLAMNRNISLTSFSSYTPNISTSTATMDSSNNFIHVLAMYQL